MSTQKLKKGFTLIELMVVIVIIGILAAIAIPKLFGMTAKAKASEVTPAASTWVKMQLAYAMEKDTYGTFNQIGYTSPGGTTFKYEGEDGGKGEKRWIAENKVDLNDCKKDNQWRLDAVYEGKVTPSIGGVEQIMKKDPDCTITNPDYDKGECMIPDNDTKINDDSDCANLTPSFSKVASIS
jgi:prepilin-type N-terminal cleavage/methylation domain-containing protein